MRKNWAAETDIFERGFGVGEIAGLVARTPKAAATADPLLYEAKNIIALNQTASVLEGGENTPLHQNGGSFQGVTPSREAMATPNTVLTTPFRGVRAPSTAPSSPTVPTIPHRSPSSPPSAPSSPSLNVNTNVTHTFTFSLSIVLRVR